MADTPPNPEHVDLELEVGSGLPQVELRHLVSLSSTFAQLINEVGEAYTGATKPVRWLVEVKKGSVRLPLRAEPASDEVGPSKVREIPSLISGGIAQLEREAVRPAYFTDKALGQVKALANGGLPLAVLNGIGRVTVTQQAAVNVDKLLGKPLESFGTVEGRLEELTIHAAPEFSIWQADGLKVRCLFGQRLALPEVLAAVGKKVAARGIVKARPNGEAIAVEVEALRVLDARDVSAESVRGLLRNYEVADW